MTLHRTMHTFKHILKYLKYISLNFNKSIDLKKGFYKHYNLSYSKISQYPLSLLININLEQQIHSCQTFF